MLRKDQLDRITPRQRQCLELTAQGYSSKEIGQRLGISDSTVDNHIAAALIVLELNDRKQASRLFVKALQEDTRQVLPRETQVLAEPHSVAEAAPATDTRGRQTFWTSPLPPLGGKENALTSPRKVITIFQIAFVSALMFIAVVMVIKASFDALS